MSRASRPAGETPNASRAATSFRAPAAHVLGRGHHHHLGGQAQGHPGLRGRGPVDPHPAGHDQGLRLLARLGEAVLGEPDVEPGPGGHERRSTMRRAMPSSSSPRAPKGAIASSASTSRRAARLCAPASPWTLT